MQLRRNMKYFKIKKLNFINKLTDIFKVTMLISYNKRNMIKYLFAQ